MSSLSQSYARFDNLDTDSESDGACKRQTEAVNSGATAQKSSPAAAHLCGSCGAEAPLLTCSRCKVVRYCSQACQRAHWKAGHKQKCVPPAIVNHVDESEEELSVKEVPAAWRRFTETYPFPSENKLKKWARHHRAQGIDENSVFIGDCPHLIWLMQPTDTEIEALEYDCLRRLYYCDVTPFLRKEQETREDGVLDFRLIEEMPEVTAIAIDLLRRYPGPRPGNFLRVHMWVFYSLLMDDDGFFAGGHEQLRQCWWERLEVAWGEWLYLSDADPKCLKPLAPP